ncbi:MAG TPA: ABC transporter permease [Gemmatimonadales bacterium]|nr:ABC transporter permease [Gemmatimonadales bacterium]
MLVGETVAVAFQSIRANKLRAMLTTLGIVIGVAAVITMVALGTGAQKAVQDTINALGPNLLTVYPGQSFLRGVASAVRVSLTTDDADDLVSSARLITAVVPEMQTQLQVKYGNQNINTTIDGTTPNFFQVKNFKLAYGRLFGAGDNASQERYAVLGYEIPNQLNANPAAMVGQTILIGGAPFEIIGVLQKKGAQGSFFNPDEQILIPLQTARYRVMGNNRLRSITVAVRDSVPMEQGLVDLERVMRKAHKIRPGADNDFRIQNQQDILATQQATTQIFTTLLASIAAVSLLVGGIGIMNIMLVSVTERTREIGVRKALGATRINILLQFLIEALVLCLAGGFVGIVLGIGITTVLAHAAGWNALVSPKAVALSFGFSAAIGIFFGIWPARRASALDPITALRYE